MSHTKAVEVGLKYSFVKVNIFFYFIFFLGGGVNLFNKV